MSLISYRQPAIRIKAIKPVPIIGVLLLLIVGCSALIRQINPVIIEKNTVLFDTVLVETVKRDTIIKKVYPIEQLKATLVTDKSVLKSKEVKTLHGYTPFEIAMYFLKAHESFRPWEYPDGKYNSKGFGLNLTSDHVKWASKKLGFNCRKRHWTYKEGQMLLREYWKEMKDQHPEVKDDFKLVALLLHKYNTGNTKSISACCGASKGCGSGNKKTREVHNERRKFEVLLYNHKVTLQMIEYYKKEAIKTDAKWKNS